MNILRITDLILISTVILSQRVYCFSDILSRGNKLDQLPAKGNFPYESWPLTLNKSDLKKYGGKLLITNKNDSIYVIKSTAQGASLFFYRNDRGAIVFADSCAIPTWYDYAPIKFNTSKRPRNIDLFIEAIANRGTDVLQVVEYGVAIKNYKIHQIYELTKSYNESCFGDGFSFSCSTNAKSDSILSIKCGYKRYFATGKVFQRVANVALHFPMTNIAATKQISYQQCFENLINDSTISVTRTKLGREPIQSIMWDPKGFDTCLKISPSK